MLRADWLAGCRGDYKRRRNDRSSSLSLIIYAMLSDVNPHYLYLIVFTCGDWPGKGGRDRLGAERVKKNLSNQK